MENIKKQQDGIEILAEMTRRDTERNLPIKDVKNVNAYWTPRHGWHLKHKKDLNGEDGKVWQDDYK